MAKKKGRARGRPERRGEKTPALTPEDRDRHDHSLNIGKRRLRSALFAAGIFAVAGALYLFIGHPGSRKGIRRDSGLNVLIITLDTTRADRLGCYGYERAGTPRIDALAEAGVLFEDAYCPTPLTLPSHASLFTGTDPYLHGVHNNGTYVLGPELATLAETLKSAGYETAAFTASFSVDSRFGLDRGFDVYDDTFREGAPFKAINSERRAGEVFDAFRDWMEQRESGRFFAWVHFFDPHLPYDPPSPYSEQFADDLYDGEIAYMDVYVGRIVDLLEKRGLLNRTLVVLAGDHGEAFGEKGESGHGVFIYDGTMKIPLVFHAPENLPRGRTVRTRARLIDVFPTVLDLLGIRPPETVYGESLLSSIAGRRAADRPVYLETFYPRENYGWSELTGLVEGEWKFIRAPRPELYHLASDPGENHDRIALESGTAVRMNRTLEDIVRRAAGAGDAGTRRMTTEEEERLRSLGYASFAGSGRAGDRPDPKDMRDVLRLTQDARAAEYAGDFASAATAYEELVESIPDSPAVYVNLALSRARLKDFESALAVLRSGVERIPDSEILLPRLGHTLLVMGRPDEALETMNRVLDINPRHVEALTVAAGILDGARRRDEAGALYARALAVEPENRFLRLNYAANRAASGRMTEAVAEYERLVADHPGDPVLLEYLGVAHGVAGDAAASVAALEKAAGIRPSPSLYINLAMAYKAAGNVGGAMRSLRRYLENPHGESEAAVAAARVELAALERSGR